jgi:hypothetical protein
MDSWVTVPSPAKAAIHSHVFEAVQARQQTAAHVGERAIALGVVGPFPHIQRLGGVKDLLGGQAGADAARYRFDVADGGDHRRVVVHC